MNDLSTQYNQVLDSGASITELFVYHLIINDDRSYGMSEKEITDMVQDVLNARYNTCKGIEEIIDNLLNGEDISGDEEEWEY